MAIPYAEDIMLPLLRYAGDGQEHSFREAIEALAAEYDLSPEDRAALRADGRTPVFDNRVGWARMYLYKAGLLESPRRSLFRITDRGREVLRDPPARITQRFLLQFPEYAAFRSGASPDGQSDSEAESQTEQPGNGPTPLAFADAAERVLQEYASRQPMHYRAITVKALELGLLRTQGQTPEATLNARISTEVHQRLRRGERPRFELHGRGLVGLTSWHDSGLGFQIERHNAEVSRALLGRLGQISPTAFEGLSTS
jgi:restriction endonuclease Mrr